MGGLMSRNKGKRAERQVIDMMQPIVNHVYREAGKTPPVLKRNTMQADGGGFDVHGLSWLALEVKHCEVLQVNTWWGQTCRQAGEGQTPVLLYKQNNVAWRCRLHAKLWPHPFEQAVEVDGEVFTYWFYYRLRHELGLK